MNSQYYYLALKVIFNYLIIFIANLEFIVANSYNLKELLRQKRYLVYPNPLDSETKVQVLFGLGLPMESEVSVILGYVLKCNYNLPYNSSSLSEKRQQRDTFDNNKIKNDVKSCYSKIKSQQSVSRWDLYRILESAIEGFGYSGKVCLLRAVCEAAELPFDRRHGLLAELLHTFLTPSSTCEYPDVYEDRQYLAAENIGRNSRYKGHCKFIFRECIYSPLDYFTF